MKSLFSIEFDFRQARQRADELDDIAANLERLAENDLQSSLQSLSTAWKGDSANLYLNKGSKLKEKMLKSVKELRKTSATIRKVAKRTYDAEMAAYRIAMARKYDK